MSQISGTATVKLYQEMNSSKNIVNNDDKNFQCEICEKFYTTKHCLQNHIDNN